MTFALTTYVTEIRMVVKANSGIQSMAQLAGDKIGVSAGSTGVRALRLYQAKNKLEADVVISKYHGDSFLLLETGRVEAFVIDDNIAAGNISLAKNPADFRLTGEVLAVELIAIMMRKDEPEMKMAVDDQIRALMRNGELAKAYDKWFMQPIQLSRRPVNRSVGELSSRRPRL